jgi:hypothetical protein
MVLSLFCFTLMCKGLVFIKPLSSRQIKIPFTQRHPFRFWNCNTLEIGQQLPRVHDAIRVKGVLDAPVRLQGGSRGGFGHKAAFHQSNAVLATENAAVP